MRTATMAAGLVSAALLSALAGCSSSVVPGPDTSAGPTASVTTTATGPATPTSSPTRRVDPTPSEPVGADRNDSDGAIAFATYYVSTLDWVYTASAPDVLQRFYAPTCTSCATRLAQLHAVVDSGGRIDGGHVTVKNVQPVADDGRRGATVAIGLAVTVDAERVLSAAGAVETSAAPQPAGTLTLWLSWTGASWQIVDQSLA